MIWDQNDFVVTLGWLFSNLSFITRKSKAQPVLLEHLASRKWKNFYFLIHAYSVPQDFFYVCTKVSLRHLRLTIHFCRDLLLLILTLVH